MFPLIKFKTGCTLPSILYTLFGGGVPGFVTAVTTNVCVGWFNNSTFEYVPSV